MNQILSDDSRSLLYFFKNINISKNYNSPTTNSLLLFIYNYIITSSTNLDKIQINMNQVKIIEDENDIPKCSLYHIIIPEIRQVIETKMNYSITYECKIFYLELKINIIFEEFSEKLYLNNYIYLIVLWLNALLIIMNRTEKKCQKLEIFLYLTSLKKNLPKKNEVISRFYANTGFTVPCNNNYSSIVIYRKEEWFKVFIHETIHFFNLDFSNLNAQETNDFILNLFPINSEVKLYESYTEFWAKIINLIITTFIKLKINNNQNNLELYLKTIQKFINFERFYILFQSVKVLNHMDISYFDFLKNSQKIENYKEQSALFSYFVINSILFHSYEDFLIWCDNLNENLLDFNNKDSKNSQYKLCQFIFKNYKNCDFLERVKEIEKLLFLLQNENYNNNNDNNNKNFILKNMRQSIFEIK